MSANASASAASGPRRRQHGIRRITQDGDSDEYEHDDINGATDSSDTDQALQLQPRGKRPRSSGPVAGMEVEKDDEDEEAE